jgi:hypothetical protein
MQAGETFTFDWSVSSESNYDKLTFYANNVEVANISGEVSFTTYTYTASSAGSFTFKWTYKKDYSVNSGRDTAWLDNVCYSGDPGLDILMGDVNFDGEVNSEDALLTLRAALGIIEFTDEQMLRGDMNGDGEVRSDDALIILRISLGIL